MSSDDEFDDLFSFSSPTKTDTSNANGVDSDTTNKAASDDDFLDDVFGAGNVSAATRSGNMTSAAVTDTDDSFLDIFDSPPPPDSNKMTTVAGTASMDDIEAEFDLLTADAGISPASASVNTGTVEVAKTAAVPPATSVHEDPAQTTVDDGSNMTTKGKSGGNLTAAASQASSEAADDDGSVPSALESAADETPLVPSAEEANMNEELPSTAEKSAVAVAGTVPSPDAFVVEATVPKELVLSTGNDTSSASSPTPGPGPSGQAPAEICAPSPPPPPSPSSEAVLAQPSSKPTNAPTPLSSIAKAPATTTSSAAALLRNDSHADDAGTREMLNFLEDSDNTEADTVGIAAPPILVDQSPSSCQIHTDLNTAPSVKDCNENDDDNFGAFATVDSATSPMGLSPTRGAPDGIDTIRHRIHSEDLNQNEDGAFDFEKEILGVVPTEEEMAEKMMKEGKEKKDAHQTAIEEAAVDKNVRSATTATDAKSEDLDTAKRTPLPRAAIMAGNTSSVRLPNLTIPSKLSNPLRRKDRAQGGMQAPRLGPAPASTEYKISTNRGMVATRKEGGGEDTKDDDDSLVKASTRMGSIFNSIKAKATTSTGGSESSVVATSAKQVNDHTAADATAASPKPMEVSSLPKLSAPPLFKSLAEASRSNKSTASLIGDLFKDEHEKSMRSAGWTVADADRAHLWVKVVTGKTLEDVESGSLVDGFKAWDESFNLDSFDGLLSIDNDGEKICDSTRSHGGALQVDLHAGILDLNLLCKVRSESRQLAHEADRMQFEGKDCFERNLCSVVLFYYRSKYAAAAEKGPFEDQSTMKKTAAQHDPQVSVIVAVLLAAALPLPAASVVLACLFSSTLPLMGLNDTHSPAEVDIRDQKANTPKEPHQSERNSAICSLHVKLYCLATYHLPLLVTHLDRHCPYWWMPSSTSPHITGEKGDGGDTNASERRHPTGDTSKRSDSSPELKAKGRHRHEGYIPTSWFVAHCVGISGTPNLDLYQIVLLWDYFLASDDSSFIFFLALAILEASSDDLLMLQGNDVGYQLYNLLTLCVKSEKTSHDCVSMEADQGDESANANATIAKVKKWAKMSMLLEQTTPKSVVKDLRSAEDVAVGAALARRRDLAEACLREKIEAEAREKRKQRQDDAKRALLKTRLTQYYRRQCPEKIDSVDRILEVYEGRYNVLDSNLRRKYGAGFLPTVSVNPQLSTSTSKLLSSVKDQKAKIAQKIESATQRQKNRLDEYQKKQDDDNHTSDLGVAVKVKADEVVPIICGRHSSTPSKDLKFILVDCRPESSQNEGKFATSVSASSLIEKLETFDESLFEGFRGAGHIVVMGDGYSDFPWLYHHQLSRNESVLAREDDARTQNCAHFFIKRGYPYVSILEGGFAAAHAWLSRHSTDSESNPLTPSSVLVNYDPKECTAAQMEQAKNASSAERTQMRLQSLLDNSMTVLTKSEEAIEKRYVTATSAENRQRAKEKLGKLMSMARTEENTSEGKDEEVGQQSDGIGAESPTDTNTCSTDLIDEKKDDETDSTETSNRSSVAAMKLRFTSFSSSVNAAAAAAAVVGSGSSGDGETRQAGATESEASRLFSNPPPSTSLKRISDALGQAKKSTAASSSLKMSFGAAKAPNPNPSSSFKPSLNIGEKLKSKISSKIQTSSNGDNFAVVSSSSTMTRSSSNDEESITFHAE